MRGKGIIGSRHAEEVARLERLILTESVYITKITVAERRCYFCGEVSGGVFWELAEGQEARKKIHHVADGCYQRARTAYQRN